MTRCDLAWPDLTRHENWHFIASHNIAWHGLTCYDMTWHDMTWEDMTWHNIMWRDMARHDITWQSTAWRDNRNNNKKETTFPTLNNFNTFFFHDTDSIEGPDGKRYVPLGCFKDSKSFRALPELVGSMRGKIDWQHMDKTVKECAHKVVVKNSTFKVTT